jgi:hypothetical protein
MTRQVKTKNVSIRGALTRAAFTRGFREAREGQSMDYDAFTGQGEINNRWHYERGRQFALIYTGSEKDGVRERWQACEAFDQALRRQWIR